MDSHQHQFCLKWNSFGSNLATAFSNLFKSESLTDVTLFCEGKSHFHLQFPPSRFPIQSRAAARATTRDPSPLNKHHYIIIRDPGKRLSCQAVVSCLVNKRRLIDLN